MAACALAELYQFGRPHPAARMAVGHMDRLWRRKQSGSLPQAKLVQLTSDASIRCHSRLLRYRKACIKTEVSSFDGQQ